MAVFTTVVKGVAIAVVIRGVATVVVSMAGAGVSTVGGTVGTVVTTVVATGVVAAGCAGCVHPLNIAKTITRINNPMNFFMEITLFSPCN